MTDLTTPEKRSALAGRSAPYFTKVAPGKHLGFRRGPQTWVARLQKPVRRHHLIGHEGDFDYEAALAAALDWFAKGGDTVIAPGKLTVRLVCSQVHQGGIRLPHLQALHR